MGWEQQVIRCVCLCMYVYRVYACMCVLCVCTCVYGCVCVHVCFCDVHCSAVVERDAAAKHIVELEKELADLKTEMSKVSLITVLSVEIYKDVYIHLMFCLYKYS